MAALDPSAPRASFVPDWFKVPLRLDNDNFVLMPLTVEHNERDYEAWSSSMDHIHSTPGFAGRRWPHPMSLEENRLDLTRHAEDFAARVGFTYTVLDQSESDVIGCVYLYPPSPDAEPAPNEVESVDSAADGYAVRARSWVRADPDDPARSIALDRQLWRAVSTWLADAWPFTHIEYASRSDPDAAT
jgi:hypothetical protein